MRPHSSAHRLSSQNRARQEPAGGWGAGGSSVGSFAQIWGRATDTIRRRGPRTAAAQKIARHTAPQPHKLRRGTSLVEVLAAILVMSVGVLSVMTLFPIAIIRSLQATQLTNATLLSKRAEAIVEMYGLTSDTYIPQPEEGRVTHALIDPLGWNDYVTVYGTSNNVPWLYGNLGGTTPASPGYLPAGLAYDPSLTNESLRAKWPRFKRPYRDAMGKRQYSDLRTLNDPSGSLAGVPLRRLSFGPVPQGFAWGDNAAGGQGPPGPYPSAGTSAFSAGTPGSTPLRDEILAAVSLPDQFDESFSGFPDAQTLSGVAQNVRFNASVTNLASLETHDGSVGVNPTATYKLVPGSRAVLIDATGRRSQVREVLASGGGLGLRIYNNGTEWVVEWRPTDPVPFFAISEIRIEVPQARYTWMLTVRKKGISGGSVSEIDCVTFFNRPLGDPNQELLHTIYPSSKRTTPPYQVRLDPSQVGPTDIYTIVFSTAPMAVEPHIKHGGWLFDPQNALWYRMIDIIDESVPGSVTVQLDRRAEAPLSWVTVPEGVVNVFPLRSRVDQKRLDSARR